MNCENCFARVCLGIAICLLPAVSLRGAGYSRGTSAAVITSPDYISAAIDSKETSREYLSDGTLVAGDHISCKVRQAGPFYAMIAGISRATGGFNALQAASEAWRSGDTLSSFASRLEDELPLPLASALTAVADFDHSFTNQDVLQIALLGAENGKPEAVILAFGASEPEPGRIAIRPRRSENSNAVHLLGMHEEAERFLAENPQARNPLQLINLEYAKNPEFVGGPATVLRVTGSGVAIEQAGACTGDDKFSGLADELDEAIAGVENIVVREDVLQYSRRKGTVHSGSAGVTVRVIDGREDYGWKQQLPEPWCGGELSTMLRITRQEMVGGRADLSIDNDKVVMRFHAAEADHLWKLVVGRQSYPLAFDATAWFASVTGKLLRIRWEGSDLNLPASAGITRLEWDETFATGDIAGQPLLAPDTALYRITYSRKTNRTDWTETHFSDFRRFGSTQSIQFDEAAIR